ncbi:MAG: HAD hydrolase-like protein [Candidatus Bathyarchaeia archaeon]
MFDLDNTLSDFMLMKEQACRAATQAMITAGLKMNEDEAYSQLIDTYFRVGIESNDAFTKFLKNAGQFDYKILAAAINSYLDAKAKYLKPYPNVRPVLRKLQKKGLFLSIVTDAPKTKAYQRLLCMEIESYFKFVVGYEDTNNSKSTGLPLLLALEMLKKEIAGVENGEILMVGDSMERDMIPAIKLGLRTALCKYGQKTVEKGNPDYILEGIKDILKIL